MLSSKIKKRGLGLYIFLVAGTLLSVVTLLQGIFYTRLLARLTHSIGINGPIEQSSLYILSGIGLAALVLFIGLWCWQKWALYLTYVFMVLLSAYSHALAIFSVSSIVITLLVGMALLLATTKPNLAEFN
ncbi:hypothetical protein M9194_20865 [Vibrio sp. S4M6]|uniref:hypothetical protein n=1 Tax=Vibrio sinus TaxID=2946865 RepID=UPI00202A9964|nr:hypothetical protein [Vibrio sinus]MCL9783878.1 hypothetical protein [Vibrio sinus]